MSMSNDNNGVKKNSAQNSNNDLIKTDDIVINDNNNSIEIANISSKSEQNCDELDMAKNADNSSICDYQQYDSDDSFGKNDYNHIDDDIEENNFTNSNNNEIFRSYVQHISRFPMLTQEKETELFNLYIDNGNQEAGQAIVLSHLRLVVKIALQYKKFGLNIMELISEGNVGLMIALKKFDRSKKARFSTYATLWVKAKIQEFILKSWTFIKVGSSSLRKQLLFNFSSLKKMLKITSETSYTEQNKKIAEHFGISEAEYADVVSSITNREASLDIKIGDENNTTLEDVISKDDGKYADKIAEKEEIEYRHEIFNKSLSILNDRQKEIIFARYLNENKKVTLEELSKKYGISKERVRQIEESAIKKLKKFAEDYR